MAITSLIFYSKTRNCTKMSIDFSFPNWTRISIIIIGCLTIVWKISGVTYLHVPTSLEKLNKITKPECVKYYLQLLNIPTCQILLKYFSSFQNINKYVFYLTSCISENYASSEYSLPLQEMHLLNGNCRQKRQSSNIQNHNP